MELILAIVLGGFFGLALYVVGASKPSQLIAMLKLKDTTLMKIIVFAIGFASVLLSLSNLIGIFNVQHLDIKPMHLGIVIGGLIFGIGFGWAGTCPGTCIAALGGNGFKKAIVAVLGGLIGAFCFSITYSWWKKIGIYEIWNLGKLTLFKVSEKYPYLFPSSYIGLMIVGLLFMGIGIIIPGGKETNERSSKSKNM